MPVIRLKSVVLPAPFGPITLTISPSVDLQVELRDDLEAAERERDAAQLEQRLVGHQTISTRRSPKRPFGRSDHEHDQHRAEHDVARRVGLGEQHVLPHERGEVERRHEQR